MKLRNKLLIAGAVVCALCVDAFAQTDKPAVELDANGDAKPGAVVPPPPARQYPGNKVAAVVNPSLELDSVSVSTDTVPLCDFPENQHELDMMRIRYANNLLYRQYDKRLNEYAVSEFAKIKDAELLESSSELGDKLREYPAAFAEVHDFLCDIQEEPDREDRAGAKVWGQRNLRKLRALTAYRASVGRVFSMVYLRDVIKRAEARLTESANSGKVVYLADICKGMESGRNTKRVYGSEINTSSLLLGSKIEIEALDDGKKKVKNTEAKSGSTLVSADAGVQAEDIVEQDQLADECDEKRYEILGKTDALRVEYAELMLTMPWAERAAAAFTRLNEVENEALSDKVSELKKTLGYYPKAHAEVAAFIDKLKEDAASHTEYSRAWYTKNLTLLHDLPAYKHIVSDEADMQIEFLENILIGLESRLDRACEKSKSPCKLGFDDFINEMRPL